MKKTAIMMLLLIAAAITANAQVPDNIRTDFDKKYPNTNATWKTENGNFNAYYTDAGKSQRMISYDQDGRVISNSTLINSRDIPANITVYYKNNYPTETNYNVWMDDMNGTKSYYSISGNNKFYFDSNGNYLHSGTVSENMPDKNMKRNNDNSNTQRDRQKQTTTPPPPAPIPNPENPK